jgi:DNA repair protein RecN (Recombination protein N)
MLRELHISNLAVISDVRIELSAGLNCFTGATGAGKSLVIGAVEVLLGLRSPAEMLRPGADEGRVSGVFEVRGREVLERIAAITDIPVASDGGELLLTRRLYASGRSSVSLNGNPITLAMLKGVAEQLVDVHGQHDHQYLLKPANQLDVVDQYGGLLPLRQAYHAVYLQVMQTKARIAELAASRTLRRQQLDLYRFQADEIDNAQLEPGEYAELQSRASVLTNLEKLKRDAGAVHAAVYEADGSVLERLKGAASVLMELADIDSNLKPIAQGLREATIQVEESTYDLSRYLDRLDLDPAELAEVNDRLNVIHRVVNKYGDTVETALGYRQELAEKLSELEKANDDDSGLQKQLAPMLVELKKLGTELSVKRIAIAKKLAPQIEKQLADLGMEKAKFTIAMTQTTLVNDSDLGASPPLAASQTQPRGCSKSSDEDQIHPTPSGFDQIEFIAQTNPGQLAQPLRKIASGGELSRIMLALKGILAQGDRVSVLVFDEIDSNVGGRLGSIIGNKLRGLAHHHQVLCITHLPQIASYAERHLSVRKEVVDNRTETKVRMLEGAERLQELAEMIGGERITDVTRAQAQELLDAAKAQSKNDGVERVERVPGRVSVTASLDMDAEVKGIRERTKRTGPNATSANQRSRARSKR